MDQDWPYFFPDTIEDLPPRMTKPRENMVQAKCLIETDHAGDHLIWRSHTGIILFVNSAPVSWWSKQEIYVEFGPEWLH